MLANFKRKFKALSSPKFIGYVTVGMIAALSAIATSLELNEVQTLERQTQSTFFIGVAQSPLPKIS